jgi:hypothetical protein
MTQQHPITPPLELVQQWDREWREQQNAPVIGWSANLLAYVATRAAQWGADQELEACCEYLVRCAQWEPEDVAELRAARRPKPPSLKEQALSLVEQHEDGWRPSPKDWDTIRRALEALPDSIVVFPSQC